VFRLDGQAYELAGQARAGEHLALPEPFPISFDPAELLL
jgi:hypothetical protein